jgi:hypothetical protein
MGNSGRNPLKRLWGQTSGVGSDVDHSVGGLARYSVHLAAITDTFWDVAKLPYSGSNWVHSYSPVHIGLGSYKKLARHA